MTRLPPRPLLHPAIIAKNWIFCPGPGTPPALLLLCSDVDVVRLRRGLGEGGRGGRGDWRQGVLVVTRGAARLAAAAAAARNCNYSSSPRSSRSCSRTARRGPALAWRNHQVVAAAVAGNSNKELVWLVVVVEVAVYCVLCTVYCVVVVLRCV